jgi:hypothetical protein
MLWPSRVIRTTSSRPGEFDVDERVAGIDADGDDAAFRRMLANSSRLRFLDSALRVAKKMKLGCSRFRPPCSGRFWRRCGSRRRFFRRLSVRANWRCCGPWRRGPCREFRGRARRSAAGVGEEHEVIVRAGGEEMLDEILVLARCGGGSRVAMPMTPLPPRRWAR